MRQILIALWIFASALSASCRTASGTDASLALINAAIGVTAAGVSRATGGCYATCTDGTECDADSGLCVPLPCRGRCSDSETCDSVTNTCIKGIKIDLGVEKDRTPVATPAEADQSNNP